MNPRPEQTQIDSLGRVLAIGNLVMYDAGAVRVSARILRIQGNGGLLLKVEGPSGYKDVGNEVVRGAYQVTRLPVEYNFGEAKDAVQNGKNLNPLP